MTWGIDKRILKRDTEITKMGVKCKCSCVTTVTPKTDWFICRWCGRKVYRTPQIKFKYEMKERLNK